MMAGKLLMFFAVLAMLSGPVHSGHIAGPGCFMTCFMFCTTMGPGKFAGFVGIVFDIQGCGAMCTALCANAAFIPGLCFGSTTTFLNETLQPVPISVIKPGDLIYTLSLADGVPSKVLTAVTNAVKVNGDGTGLFNFVELRLVNTLSELETITLTVTEDHGMLVLDEPGSTNSPREIQASRVAVGHVMIGAEKQWEVRYVKPLTLPEKYVVFTEAGTALASGILATTSCLEE